MAICKICGKNALGRRNYCGKYNEKDTCAFKHYKQYLKDKKKKYPKSKLPRDREGIGNLQYLNWY